MGRIYSTNGKVNESKKYFNLAISLSKKYNDKAMLCSTYCDLGSLLVFESKHLEAIHYFTESLKIAEEIKLDELAFYNLYYISDLYIEEKNLEKSFEYSFKALSVLKIKTTDLITIVVPFMIKLAKPIIFKKTIQKQSKISKNHCCITKK